MENFLPKAAVLAVVAAGFCFTGDLGWLASKGLRVLNAADVAAPSLAQAEAGALPPMPAPVPPPGPPAAPAPRVLAPAAPAAPTAPAGQQAAAHLPVVATQPPTGGLDQIAWPALRAGDRVVVWLSAAGHRCLVLDVVDPATGEALAYEVATVADDGRPLTALAPPTRVVVGPPAGGSAPGIVKGGMLHIAPAGIAAAGAAGRWLGPVEALTRAR